jgi:site-specific recombinase XerD
MSSELRTKFNNYMTLRGFSPKTKTAYINAVEGLAKFYMISPDQLTNDQIQTYLLYLIEDRKLAWSTCNVAFSAYRCFYSHLLKRNETEFHIPPRTRQRQLPVILSVKEVKQIIDSAGSLRNRTLLKTVYSAGLRVSEVVALKAEHIESKRKLIRVEQGKGKKDRYTILSDRLLTELRKYWKIYHPESWIFFGRDRSEPMTIWTAQKIFYKAKKKAGIKKGNGIHTLRHCFATHTLEQGQGQDIYVLKRMLGHTSLETTMTYLHITNERISTIKSPLDLIYD